jgi:hypothetical protein
MNSHVALVPTDSKSLEIGSLRWYAGLAMQSIIEKQESIPMTEAEREEISLWAWRMGQAMIATEQRICATDRGSC